jgi:putative spermidine/putrescine transport system substrate-binding protein
MRRGVACVLAVALAIPLLTGVGSLPAARAAGAKLIVTSYGGPWEQFMRTEILPGFQEQFNTGVELAVGLSKDWTASMYSASPDRSPYDVVITNEIWAADHRRKGYYVPLPAAKVPNLKDAYPLVRRPNDVGVLFIILPMGLAYRTDLVAQPPLSWKDLWKPEYKGKLGLYTITNTAGGLFLMLTSKVWSGNPKNSELAFQKIKELKPFRQTDFSGNMETLLTQGEIQIGVLDLPAVARLRHQGVKIAAVMPLEGLIMFEQDANVTKGSQNKEAAYAFINYLLSPAVQEKWVRKFFASPGNKKVDVPADLRSDIPIFGNKMQTILQWDWDWFNDRKEDFIKRWNREISG